MPAGIRSGPLSSPQSTAPTSLPVPNWSPKSGPHLSCNALMFLYREQIVASVAPQCKFLFGCCAQATSRAAGYHHRYSNLAKISQSDPARASTYPWDDEWSLWVLLTNLAQATRQICSPHIDRLRRLDFRCSSQLSARAQNDHHTSRKT